MLCGVVSELTKVGSLLEQPNNFGDKLEYPHEEAAAHRSSAKTKAHCHLDKILDLAHMSAVEPATVLMATCPINRGACCCAVSLQAKQFDGLDQARLYVESLLPIPGGCL